MRDIYRQTKYATAMAKLEANSGFRSAMRGSGETLADFVTRCRMQWPDAAERIAFRMEGGEILFWSDEWEKIDRS
jgi:hypothetical protein